VPQIMSRLAKRHKVLFVNSLGMRIPSLRSDKNAMLKIFRKAKSILHYLRKDPCGMYVFSPVSVPFQNKIGKKINQMFLSLQLDIVMKSLAIHNPIYYIGCPPAWEIIRHRKRPILIYERTDIFEEMPGADKKYISQLNQDITKASDLVLYVNHKLMQHGKQIRQNGLMLGHGVDYELFSSACQSNYIPDDIAHIPRPIAGFFGDLNREWCNLSLLEYAVNQLPKVSFVLVGPVSSDVSNLQKYKNIYFLGRKPYSEIPHYGKQFDIALMPWNQNRWIEYCNPVKTKEYLALGLPIVSVDYPELGAFRDIIYASKNEDEFVNNILVALNEKSSDLSQRRRKRVANETWDAKVKLLEETILSIKSE